MIYVMADIHGFANRYEEVMAQINLKHDDHLYILGDVIDRLPDGIDLLMEVMNIPNITVLLGNHEDMMLQTVDNNYDPYYARRWFANGGSITLDAFEALTSADQTRLLQYIRSLPLNVEVSVNGTDYLLVHGAPVSTFGRTITKYPDERTHAVWKRLDPYSRIPEGKTVIFGHTPTDHYQTASPLRIWYGERMIGIDCGSATRHDGRLACLRLDDMKEFYSSTFNDLT